MAYTSVNLPAPAANGSGAAVDVSAFGGTKTITVHAGGDGVHAPSVLIEVSNQASPTKWAPLAYFQPDGEQTISVAARWMRATVTNFTAGDAPVVEVGGEDSGTSFATLVAPAGDGNGTGVDVSALGPFKTIHVAGPYRGVVNIEISGVAGGDYQQAFSFPSGEAGLQSAVIQAELMRVSRAGVPELDAGTPIVNVGGTDAAGGGGGGSETDPFQYVATGAEGASVPITFASARASADYNVQVSYGGPNALKILSPRVSSFTVNGFTLDLSAAAEAGDIFMFSINSL